MTARPPKETQMATCPRCKGALTDNHRCPKGRFVGLSETLLTAGVGGIVGGSLCYVIQEGPALFLVISYAALGAVLAYAMRQAIAP